MGLSEDLRRAVIEAAIDFENTRTIPSRDALFAAVVDLKTRKRFFVAESSSGLGNFDLVLRTPLSESLWAVAMERDTLDDMATRLNQDIQDGWNP